MLAVLAMTPFAEWLETRMRARGITKSQLAAFIGSKPSTVGAWFTDDRIPSPEMCQRLAGYFGIPLEDVMRSAGHLPPARITVEETIIPELQLRIRRFSPAEQRRYLLPAIELAQTLREPMEGDEVDPPSPDDDSPAEPRRRRR